MLQVVRELNLAERWSLGGNEDAAASKLSSLVEPSYESQKGLTVVTLSIEWLKQVNLQMPWLMRI